MFKKKMKVHASYTELPGEGSAHLQSPVAFPVLSSPATTVQPATALDSLVAESNAFGAVRTVNATPEFTSLNVQKNGLQEKLVDSDSDGLSYEKRMALEDYRHTSFGRTTFNAINLLVGMGILSLPYAFKCGGIVYTAMILLFITLLTSYTAHLLKKCIDLVPGTLSFADMGMEAFGRFGSTGITIVFVFELFTACAMYLVIFGDNIHAVEPHVDHQTLLYIGALLCLPQVWTRNLKVLSYLSIIGILTSVVLLGVVLYTGLFTNDGPGSLLQPADSIKYFGDEKTAMAIGLVMVGFTGHACFPNIYGEMSSKKDYPSVVNTSYVVTFGMYASLGLSGYLIYGESTMKEITLNLHGTLAGDIATWLVVINPVVKYGLTLNPVALMLEKALGLYDGDDIPSALPQTFFERMKWPICLVIRTALVGLTLVTAIALPHFDQILALCGSAFSFTVSVIFPISVYLKLHWAGLSVMSIAFNSILLLLGVGLAVLGTWAAIVFPPA